MKKYLKVIFSSLFIALIIIFALGVYQVRLSERALKAYKNVENSKSISKGMERKDVIRIMGVPDKTCPDYSNTKQTIYFYEPPFASSAGIEIYLDTQNKVDRIILFE